MARALNFAGAKAVAAAALPWRVVAQGGDARIASGPEWERENVGGIEWVWVYPGSFTMGSQPGEPMAYESEIVDPPRIVTLSAFQISASETTNAQYARAFPEHSPRDDLPSEAQWQYAARGGSRTRWPFGDDETQFGRHAWFADNSGRQAHPVAQKLPNPLGLHDMHGNAEEWTRDF
ncbi:MAG: formylglycine-generating enzyme family protein [Candidatus Accumulibacter sp.]|uniref:formylglycine-generating enzyme family protein n=1 Tax=Accumulibacter sp. TaxID=2053492 RepID=UPI0025F36458|nr:formylglycine-generating enzyme family protein [Accumulibacter sp.]MCM8599827.1 formylglycine-generating enzyme family protein [Accumulibacter sp.]MCM8662741.1 formylglycine-generating enzyme family protein [Accumulibacter sp.]